MKLFDTAEKCYLDYQPDHLVRIYVCGITPYDSAHLGHIFTFMTYDLLQRRLEDLGHEVQMVRNITDVDEPIYAKAKELGLDYRALASKETASFQATLQTLRFLKPFAEPLASDYIIQMSEAVQKLLDRGFAYRLAEDIYFDIAKFPAYERFSGFNERLIKGLAQMRGGDPERDGKRQSLDFLLWKGITEADDPAQWQTGLGAGRPGWHIECSVMSCELLGLPFDIHGGGTDLIFPHHSSEIAQSYGLGVPVVAKTWLHVSPLLFDGEKMSKSLGNLVFAHDLLGTHEAAVIRLSLMHYHHRVGGEWLPELLVESTRLLGRVRHSSAHASVAAAEILLADVRTALDDDLNTLEVIDALHRFVATKHAPEAAAAGVVDQTLRLLGLAD
jgi:L-cysteine:1D-myo-inositol 2-amino-2-deoxy-alpha-D-glucopyranoside ligase